MIAASPIFDRRPVGRSGTQQYRAPGAVLHAATCDRKLAPVGLERHELDWHALRPFALGPFVSATYVAIKATCPSACTFRERGCYVREGFTGRAMRLLDERAGKVSGDDVIAAEAELIDGAFRGVRGGTPGTIPQDGGRDGSSGRDLRLHIGGDASSERGAELLSGAAYRWLERCGGEVWTYTHLWDVIDAATWFPISALASVESAADAVRAIARGYVPAIVLPSFPADTSRPFRIAGLPPKWRALACPAETRGTTCVQCRACLNTHKLREAKIAIAFAAHGGDGGARARRALQVLQ